MVIRLELIFIGLLKEGDVRSKFFFTCVGWGIGVCEC